MTRTQDWLDQALHDLELAQAAQDENRHGWACFAAQQAAEKAVRALYLQLERRAEGHVVARLLADLPSAVPSDLIERAKVLDTYYAPTRYPVGDLAGAPFQHYGPMQSGPALDHASAIIAFVSTKLV